MHKRSACSGENRWLQKKIKNQNKTLPTKRDTHTKWGSKRFENESVAVILQNIFYLHFIVYIKRKYTTYE